MALSLGWVPSKADRETTYQHLNAVLPAQLKFDLHVLMVPPSLFLVALLLPWTTARTHTTAREHKPTLAVSLRNVVVQHTDPIGLSVGCS